MAIVAQLVLYCWNLRNLRETATLPSSRVSQGFSPLCLSHGASSKRFVCQVSHTLWNILLKDNEEYGLFLKRWKLEFVNYTCLIF